MVEEQGCVDLIQLEQPRRELGCCKGEDVLLERGRLLPGFGRGDKHSEPPTDGRRASLLWSPWIPGTFTFSPLLG